MRKSLLALFAVALLVVVAVPMVDASDDYSPNATWTISGQISHGSMPKESPSEMTINLYKINGDVKEKYCEPYVGKLNSTGTFELKVSKDIDRDNFYISIQENGYMVYGKTDCMEEKSKGLFKIDWNIADVSEEDHTCKITNNMEYIQMCSAFGTLKGKIVSSAGGNPPLNGVKVIITSADNNDTLTVLTHGDGTFYFDKVGIGRYTLKAESKGFENYTYPDTISVNVEGYELKTPLQMTPTNGIDMAHWMTLIGIVAALLLLLGVVIHVVKVKKKKSSVE